MIDQLWKLEDNTLKNKKGIWKSNHHWKVETKGSEEAGVHIINESKRKFLSVSNNGSKVLENDSNHVWIKGSLDNEGYFTLLDASTQKVLTAVSPYSLQLRGNRKINSLLKGYMILIFIFACRFKSENSHAHGKDK